jgi:hypothetical protein
MEPSKIGKSIMAASSGAFERPPVGARTRTRAVVRGVVLAMATVATTALATADALAQGVQPSIVGTWRVTRMGVNCQTGQPMSSFPAIMVFHDDGTYNGFGASPGSTPADGSPEYGVWKRSPDAHGYTFRILGLPYDGATVVGTVEITGAAEVPAKGETLSYTSTIQFIDLNGNPLFTLCGKATGVRFE